jgi:hypothetical protein
MYNLSGPVRSLNLKDLRRAEKKVNRLKVAFFLVTAIFLSGWIWDMSTKRSSLLIVNQALKRLKMLSLDDLPDFGTKVLSAVLLYLMKRQLSFVTFTDLLLHSWVQSEIHAEQLRVSENHKHQLYQKGVLWACQRFDSVYNCREGRREMVIPTVLKILDDEAYAEIDALRNHTNEALHKLDDEAHAELNHLRNTTKEALHKVQVALSPFTGHGKSPTAPDHHDENELRSAKTEVDRFAEFGLHVQRRVDEVTDHDNAREMLSL